MNEDNQPLSPEENEAIEQELSQFQVFYFFFSYTFFLVILSSFFLSFLFFFSLSFLFFFILFSLFLYLFQQISIASTPRIPCVPIISNPSLPPLPASIVPRIPSLPPLPATIASFLASVPPAPTSVPPVPPVSSRRQNPAGIPLDSPVDPTIADRPLTGRQQKRQQNPEKVKIFLSIFSLSFSLFFLSSSFFSFYLFPLSLSFLSFFSFFFLFSFSFFSLGLFCICIKIFQYCVQQLTYGLCTNYKKEGDYCVIHATKKVSQAQSDKLDTLFGKVKKQKTINFVNARLQKKNS